MGKQSTVTLRDIAKHTGYSVNTVSHALNGKQDISETTRKLICSAAAELGYIGNASASYMRSGISKTIAVILGDIANPHFAIVVREIDNYIRSLGYTAIILNTDENEENERQAIISAVQKNVDGIVICPVQKTRDNLEFLKKTGVPYVLIGRRFFDDDSDSVICDDENSGYIAAEYLVKAGHKNILFLNAPHYVSSASERLCGYKRALSRNNIAFDSALVKTGALQAGEWGEVVTRTLKDHPEITAVIAFSDLIAWEVILTIERAGMNVPQDIAVVGFDNIQSGFLAPIKLTTVSGDKNKMANTAAKLIMEKINGGSKEHHQIVLPTTLTERNSII